LAVEEGASEPDEETKPDTEEEPKEEEDEEEEDESLSIPQFVFEVPVGRPVAKNEPVKPAPPGIPIEDIVAP
jgi:hypothetical protein